MTYKVGIIGCGRPWKSDGATGFGMSHAHAEGYNTSPDAEIVALADINLENARAFQEQRGGDRLYDDYKQMLVKEELDIVSISTWPHLHAPMVIDCVEAGVKAIHCEKPMALTWGQCKHMVTTAEENGVQLTFNHQRRFNAPFLQARELIRSGAIGNITRIEMNAPDLFDWGTHWFDMMFLYNEDTPAEWVIGQIDVRNHRTVFGVVLEGHGMSHVKFQNNVYGLFMSGEGAQGLNNRIIGTAGMIDVGYSEEIPLRIWAKGQSEWQTIVLKQGIHGMESVQVGVHDLIESLKLGREPELSAQRALRASELIFATYESSRRRGRVDLPLEIDDSPLHAMIESGVLTGDS